MAKDAVIVTVAAASVEAVVDVAAAEAGPGTAGGRGAGGFLLNLKSLDVVIEADLPPKSKSLHVSLITTKCQSIKKLPPLALLLSRAQSSRGRVESGFHPCLS